MSAFEVVSEVEAAETRIRDHVRETPVEPSPALRKAAGIDVHLKLESQQLSGSFKLRGAMNKLLSLSEDERKRGVVTASSGNHAGAVAYGLHRLGGRGVIYLPETVSQAKVDSLEPFGMELRFVGSDSVEGEHAARAASGREGLTYVSPYNDPQVIGGQGTIGLELTRQLEAIDNIFVPVGGGGLVAGIAGYLKSARPELRVYGCQPERSKVMCDSVRAGRLLDVPSEPTLADGTAGGVETDAVTFPLCQSLVDEWVLLSEEEIRDAMRFVIEKHSILIEGAAALGVAALRQRAAAGELSGTTAVVVVTGKKVSLETLRAVLG